MNGLSKSDINAIFDIVEDCANGSSLNDFLETVKKLQNTLQVENIVFLSSELNNPLRTASVKEINLSYPQEWAKEYRECNYLAKDPIIQCGRSGLLFWDEVYAQLPPEEEFLSQARSYGLENGFSHILPSRSTFGLFSVAEKSIRNDKRTRTIINTIAPHLHLFASLIDKEIHETHIISLTDREREVLLWVMEGKSNWEISVILNISQESIKSHLKNIFRKLDATNRAHAVAIALKQKCITLT